MGISKYGISTSKYLGSIWSHSLDLLSGTY